MRHLFALAILVTSTNSRAEHTGGGKSASLTADSSQVLVVRSSSWYAAVGRLELYTKDPNGRWKREGNEVPVSLGRNGMGWGRGLHPPQKLGPFKKEGDKRSPAGIFSLQSAFGVAESLPSGARKFPYLHTLSSSYCVEDVRSDHYNEIIDSREVTRTSWEKWSGLRRGDGLFDWGVIVRQNSIETKRGAGSCVFLHIWRGSRIPTSGCTAMPRPQLEGLLRWLDPDASPLLVQLPENVYEKQRAVWGLP